MSPYVPEGSYFKRLQLLPSAPIYLWEWRMKSGWPQPVSRFTGDLISNFPGWKHLWHFLHPLTFCSHSGKWGRTCPSCSAVFSEGWPIPQSNWEPPASKEKPPSVSKCGVPECSWQLPAWPPFSSSTILLFCFYLLKQQLRPLCIAAAFSCWEYSFHLLKIERFLQWPLLPHRKPFPHCCSPGPDAAICTALQWASGFVCWSKVRGQNEGTEKQAWVSCRISASVLLPQHGMVGLGSCAGCGWKAKAAWPCLTTLQVINCGLAPRDTCDTKPATPGSDKHPFLGAWQCVAGAGLHCIVAGLPWGLQCHLAPVNTLSLHQPNTIPQASKSLPPAAAGGNAKSSCSPCGRTAGHSMAAAHPWGTTVLSLTAPDWIGTCCWAVAAVKGLLQLWQLLSLVCSQN